MHQLSQRLNSLSFTRLHAKVLTTSGVGWALDALDVALVSYVIAVLRSSWNLSGAETGWIVSAGFVGMTIGAMLGGKLADSLGRRTVFAITLLIFGVASGLAAFAPGLAVFLILRVIIGLGLGAELPVASTYVSEFAPPRIRGRVIVALEAFWAVGWLVAALLGYFVVPHLGDWGWRIAMLVGALPAVYAAIVRIHLPESVLFLISKGRLDDAEAIVQRFERSRMVFEVAPVTEHLEEDAAAESDSHFRALWSGAQGRNTIGLTAVWFFVNFSYYGAFIWIPSLLVARGYDLVSSFGYTLVMTLAQLPGYAAAAWLVERWGRRTTLAVFLAGSAVSALVFGWAPSLPVLLAAGLFLSFFNLGAWGALYAISPELFPTALRGAGTGWAAGAGRIASIVAPLIVPALLASIGQPGLFAVFAAAFIVAAAATFLLSEYRGKPLRA